MAFLSAFIIPIGALVAGDGLASLALERRSGTDFREERWQEVAYTVIYRAVFVRYLHQGIVERDARHRAASEVKGYLGKASSSAPSTVRLLSAGNEQDGQKANGQLTSSTVKGRVREYLKAHPDMTEQSVNQVLSALQEAGIKAGRTTVAEVLKAIRQLS